MEATDSLGHNQYLVRNRYGEDEIVDLPANNSDLTNLPKQERIDEVFTSVRGGIVTMDFCSVESRKEMLALLDKARALAHQEHRRVQNMARENEIPQEILDLKSQGRRDFGLTDD